MGDNENAIEIQIFAAMLANLLITLAKSKLKGSWAFSNLVSVIRQQLINYIYMYGFLEVPEESCRAIIKENKDKIKYSLFPEIRGLTLEKPKKRYSLSECYTNFSTILRIHQTTMNLNIIF